MENVKKKVPHRIKSLHFSTCLQIFIVLHSIYYQIVLKPMPDQSFSVPQIPSNLFQNDPKKVIPDDIISYISERIEYVPYEGIMLYIQGATYPKRGFPTPEAIAAINIVKQLLFQSLRFPLQLFVTNKVKLLTAFNILFDKCFTPYKLKEEFLCPTAYNFALLVEGFASAVGIPKDIAKSFSYNLAHILEYDDAYRYRLQDILSETTHYKFTENPKKEIKRLTDVLKHREGGNKGAFYKTQKLLLIVLVVLSIPKYKNALVKSLTPEILIGMQYTKEDEYWARLKGDDYLFTGTDYTTRTQGLQIPQAYKITM